MLPVGFNSIEDGRATCFVTVVDVDSTALTVACIQQHVHRFQVAFFGRHVKRRSPPERHVDKNIFTQ